jgi:hypothetical protein
MGALGDGTGEGTGREGVIPKQKGKSWSLPFLFPFLSSRGQLIFFNGVCLVAFCLKFSYALIDREDSTTLGAFNLRVFRNARTPNSKRS